jgi:hypothetical protein
MSLENTNNHYKYQIELRKLQVEVQKEKNRRIKEKTPKFRGNAALIQSIRESCEFILSGPYETGKTFAALWLLDTLLREFPNSRAAILRKIRATMDGTVLETWRNVIAIRGGVEVFGGNRPVWYDYSNGSRVYIGGLDDPGKSLSGERDFIYCNQGEELDQEDWETLSTRASGRAAHAIDARGVPIAILFGDVNPSHENHWILSRDRLQLLPTSHKDNPTLYDNEGNLTPRGKQTMEVLDALTGVQRDRGRDGKWVAAEGLVYQKEWADGPEDGNVTNDDYIPGAGPVIWWVDDGYTGKVNEKTGLFTPESHPRVFLLCQLLSTGRVVVFDESYAIYLLEEEHIARVLEKPYPVPMYAVVDKSAVKLQDRIRAKGIAVYHVAPQVTERIKNSRSWIAADKNGIRRMVVNKRCRQFRYEMVSYKNDPIVANDKPLKKSDNGPDAMGYGQWYEDFEQGSIGNQPGTYFDSDIDYNPN